MSRIALLPTEVVDKIAAGEVVVRPVNAVKELIENSLDAGATEITVSVRRGGLDLIKVQDNGSGIAIDDMPIVCERFATSKLREYEDLQRMQTFGFRGEALASISYVAKVEITSRQSSDPCAHKAAYQDGKMVGAVSRSAGLVGTVVSAENLFYNCPARHRAMKYPQEEATRIVDLLVKYAIENPSVAFAVRRLDGPFSDFRSAGNGDRKATIRALLGPKIGKDLLDTSYEDASDLHFSFRAMFSAPIAAYTSAAVRSRQERYKTFHLFINGRHVDCPRLKQLIDLVFAGRDFACQFINISLQIDPERVDVNVHPTKSIVHFLHEDRIIQAIEEHMSKLVGEYCVTGMIEIPIAVKSSPSSSGNQPQPIFLRPTSPSHGIKRSTSIIGDNSDLPAQSSTVKRPRISDFEPPARRTGLTSRTSAAGGTDSDTKNSATTSFNFAQRVRVDANNRRMVEFLTPVLKPSPGSDGDIAKITSDRHMVSLGNESDSNPPVANCSQRSRIAARSFQLDSLDNLRREICRQADDFLTSIFRKHYFVGLYKSGCGVFQVDESVYLVQLDVIVREFFYQLVVFSFGNIGSYRLEVGPKLHPESLCVSELLALHFELNEMDADSSNVDYMLEKISAMSPLLWDYFSLGIELVGEQAGEGISDDGPLDRNELILKSVPCIIDAYVPPLEALPELIFDLGSVNCVEEERCFKEIAEALAKFLTPITTFEGNVDGDDGTTDLRENRELLLSSLCRFVLPALKSKFLPSSHLCAYVRKITSIEVAFKKFGRC